MTPLSIRMTILRALADAQPYMLPATTLLAECNRLLRPAIKTVDFDAHLGWLKDRDFVDCEVDRMDPDNAHARRWQIKEAGLAALKS